MKMLPRAKAVCTFTLTELVMAAVIFGLLAAVFFPHIIEAKDSLQLNTVYSNLRNLDDAKEAWGGEHRTREGAASGGVQARAAYAQGGGERAVMDEQHILTPMVIPAGVQSPAGVTVTPRGRGSFLPAP